MSNQARTNQSGSVVSFLIVGLVLAALTLGGIYFVQQRNQNIAQTPASPTPSASPSTSPSSQTTTPGATSTTPSPSKTPSPSTSTSPRPSSSPSSSPKPSATPAPTSTPQTGYMPETGPVENLVAASLPIALFIGLTVSYLRSRKQRFGSFYR